MNTRRSIVAAVAACFALASVRTQSAEAKPTVIETPFGKAFELHRPSPPAENARWTLWLTYRSASGSLPDHMLYLGDLQRRYAAQGLTVAVMLPSAEAKLLAAQKPGFVVAGEPPNLLEAMLPSFGGNPEDHSMQVMPCVLCDGTESVRSLTLDSAIDVLQPCLEGKPENMPDGAADEMLESMLGSVGDAYQPVGQSAPLVAMLPHSGRARALRVLEQWWCAGDYEAAKIAIDDGFKALAGETVPMCLFADLLLRGDRTDVQLAQRIAAELGPVAAAAPDGAFTQLVYLRALLRARQDRLAGRLIAKLPKLLERRAFDLLLFAETLMEGGTPGAFRDLAEKSIRDARVAGADARWGTAARHKVLVRCGDLEAAEKLMVDYRSDPNHANNLNNDAWYLMTRPESMGRFDTFALAQCEEMQRQAGGALDSGSQDTVALSLFLNGKLREAVELQTIATKASQQSAPYVARLTRFTAALEANSPK